MEVLIYTVQFRDREICLSTHYFVTVLKFQLYLLWLCDFV